MEQAAARAAGEGVGHVSSPESAAPQAPKLEENFHVQSCYTTKDRVCDTVHEIDTTTKDDLQCVELESPNCHMEDKILVDKVCTDTVEFECSPDKKLDNAGYGIKDTVCREIPKHDCYDSPRTVRLIPCNNPDLYFSVAGASGGL